MLDMHKDPHEFQREFDDVSCQNFVHLVFWMLVSYEYECIWYYFHLLLTECVGLMKALNLMFKIIFKEFIFEF